ncbi:4-hydroxy-tetrahydrodipicolinate synthase [Methylocystis bryophila]|uniref:4-hydroxy-tetrahydrodipicolinate synthase n=1 Tax=Methylocystis bryophila TaxID=655015 RepID=A0A1W6N1F9_9HYPH|nr:4-hydroxy-tetrahydrodipicolinate synthase [Methylocystis bryophila]
MWLTAAPTPFAEDDIAEDAFARYVAWQIDEGCGGLVVGGAMGEGATLSRRERLRLIEIAAETASRRAVVIVATGTNCTRESIERTEAAQMAGASAALLATPYYNKPGQRGLLSHFQEIARAVDLPLIIEIDPARTAVDIGPETLTQLAEIPNIVAIAHADGGLASLRKRGPSAQPNSAHLCGSDDACAQFCLAGGSGWISSTANIVPALWSALQRAVDAKQWDRAMLIEMALQPLTFALQRESGAAPLKYALSLLHPWFSPQVRLPLTPVAAETAREIRACFARF